MQLTTDNYKIILFDGVCNLCNSSVQFVIKNDKENQFRFAALQSDAGKNLLLERGLDTNELDSIVLIEPGIAYYVKSEAALNIGKQLKGYRTISSILKLIPSNISNFVYDLIAKNRYKWYGKKDNCMVPTPELADKFLN